LLIRLQSVLIPMFTNIYLETILNFEGKKYFIKVVD